MPKRKLDVVAQFVQPHGDAHFTVSLSSNVGHGSFEVGDVAETTQSELAGGCGIHTAGDQLTGPHLDMQGKLLVDFLIDRHTPEPRTQRTLHLENRTFDTPAENRRHVAVSAANC